MDSGHLGRIRRSHDTGPIEKSYVLTLHHNETNPFVNRSTLANSGEPDEMPQHAAFHQGPHRLLKFYNSQNMEIPTCHPLRYIMDNPILIASFFCGENPLIYKGLSCR